MDGIELKQADHNAMSPSPVRSLPPSAVLESVTSERLSHPSLKRLCKHIDRRMRLHRMSAAYYRRKNLVFLYPSVILNTAASILSFTGAIYTDAEKPISVTVGVCTAAPVFNLISISCNTQILSSSHRLLQAFRVWCSR